MNTSEAVRTVVLPGAPALPVGREREQGVTRLLVVIPLVALVGAALALAALSAVATSPSHVGATAAPVEQEEVELPSASELGDAGSYALRLGPVYTR